MQVRMSKDLNAIVNNDDCHQCDKLVTCYIFRDFMKIMMNGEMLSGHEVTEESINKLPVQPKHLAKICAQFHPKDMLQ